MPSPAHDPQKNKAQQQRPKTQKDGRQGFITPEQKAVRQAMGLAPDDPRTIADVYQARKMASMQARVSQLAKPNPEAQNEEEAIQQKAELSSGAAANEKGRLPNDVLSGFKGSTGHDLSDVDVHYNSSEPESMGALAYAQGNEIHLAPGQEQHLPHEAAHIVQQREGRVQPTGEMNGLKLNDDASLESEADSMGAAALQMKAKETALPPENDSENAVVAQFFQSPAQRVEDPNKPDLESYRGAAIGQTGHISSPAGQYAHAVMKGVNVRSKPDGRLTPIGTLRYNEVVHVVASNIGGGYVFVIGSSVNGWINKDFVATGKPDPKAQLHHITEANLSAIFESHYIKGGRWTVSTGNDLTTLAAAVLVANAGRIGVSMDWKKYQAYKDDNWLRGKADPWMHENFAIYHGSKVVSGTNIWLPSAAYIRTLQSSGLIGSRPGWLNAALGLGKSLAGFTIGVQAGIYGDLWDMLTGLWDMGKMLINTIKGIFDGSLFTSIKDIYDDVTSMTMEKAKKMVSDIVNMGKTAVDDFSSNWNHGDEYKKWFFRGKIIGTIVTEIVLAIVTAGASLGEMLILKLGKYFPKLAGIVRKVLKVADKLHIGGKKKKPDLDVPDGHPHPKGHHPDGDKTPDFDPNDNEARDWFTTLGMAKLITEGHDAADTPVKLLLVQLNRLAARSGAVHGYEAEPLSEAGHFRIVQFAKRTDVSKDYSDRGGYNKDLRIGKYQVPNDKFHREIKPNILADAPKFSGKVGKNPDIDIVNNEIIFKGNGPFKGKSMRTGLDPKKYFK